MGSQAEQPQRQGRQYTDEEWERVREPFRHYYVEKNMPLKEASRKIRDDYGFDATARQWERRIGPDKWNMPKYASRDDRLKAVEAVGLTLESLSGGRGRRKSTGSSDEKLRSDRNMRRWARRELSRDSTRPRARSTSGLSDVSDADMSSVAHSPMMHAYDSMTTMPQPLFNEAWLPSPFRTPSAQSFHDAPSQFESQPIPQITFTVPDEHSQMMSDIGIDPMVQSTQDQQFGYTDPSIFTPSAVTGQTAYSLESQLHIADTVLSPQPSYTWPVETMPVAQNDGFVMDPVPSTSQNSYIDMMNSQITSNLPTTQIDFIDVDNSSRGGQSLADDSLPDLDNTYGDVHTILQAHHSQVTDTIMDCLTDCARNGANAQVMQCLGLLIENMKKQNTDLNRSITQTLQNVSATQRQATRYVFEMSKARKKQIDELRAQLAALQVNQITI